MIVIEGIRRSGKSFALNALTEKYKYAIFYKDEWMKHIYKNVDVDDFVIGRDITYAQIIPKLQKNKIIVFDRQYWSSYVYGQFYRKKYDKEFWANHIRKVESIYNEFVKNIFIIFITVDDDGFKRIATMNRSKDSLESDNINDYIEQYKLYLEVKNLSKVNVLELKCFSSKDDIYNLFEYCVDNNG